MTLYRKLGRDRLYETIVSEIEQLIVAGQLRPGDVLPPERELGERFGVSRTAVREAIKVLTEKQLLVVQPGRGATVAHPSLSVVTDSLMLLLKLEKASAAQLTEVRMGLEPEMAALAAMRATEQQAGELEAIAKQEMAVAGEPEQAIPLDIAFHTAVCEAAQNAVAKAMLLSIQDLMRKSMTETYGDEKTVDFAIHSHLRIAHAIAEHDPQGAAAEMRRHLDTLADKQGLRVGTASMPRG
jgi:GntR family transcriptional repressor for pyruvate dehydrogenase complex